MNTTSMGMTRRLARFAANTPAEDIPPAIYEHAKVAFMDWLGVTLAGKSEPAVNLLLEYADLMGGDAQATILGYGIKKSVAQAALINGTASHALDYDDTLAAFSGHPSVTLFPGLVALSEYKEINGKAFLAAYIIGIKIGSVIGVSSGPGHYASGFHATSTVGSLAAAAACCHLLGYDENRIINALGIAGTQSAGLKRVFGTMCKPFHAGRASEVGIMAAILSEKGFTSAEDILEGPNGFFNAMGGQVNETALDALGATWAIESLAQKYHASCHYTHSAIEAALSIVKHNGLSIADMGTISVLCSEIALATADKIEARTGLEGKFSIPYCVASALLRGNTGLAAFADELVAEPEIISLMKKISVVTDPHLTGMETRVDIKTAQGQSYAASSDIFKDIPGLAVKKQKIRDKFRDLAKITFSDDQISDIIDMIADLEKLDTMESLIERLRS